MAGSDEAPKLLVTDDLSDMSPEQITELKRTIAATAQRVRHRLTMNQAFIPQCTPRTEKSEKDPDVH